MVTTNGANQSSTGIQSLTSGGAFNGRTITGTANQISIANGDGTAGNPTISLTSNIYVTGISFDSGGNTLSAYASGSFTPTLTGSSSNPTVTYAANGQVGLYQKIGNKVQINGHLKLASASGGTGNVQLDSLPFTSLNSTNATSTTAMEVASVTFGASVAYYCGTVNVNSVVCICEGVVSAGAIVDLVVGGLSASSLFNYAGSYNI